MPAPKIPRASRPAGYAIQSSTVNFQDIALSITHARKAPPENPREGRALRVPNPLLHPGSSPKSQAPRKEQTHSVFHFLTLFVAQLTLFAPPRLSVAPPRPGFAPPRDSLVPPAGSRVAKAVEETPARPGEAVSAVPRADPCPLGKNFPPDQLARQILPTPAGISTWRL